MEIHIDGHSGCDIHLYSCLGKYFVRKSTDKLPYVSRLKKQASKQALFKYNNKLPEIDTPIIMNEREDRNSFRFDMQYINAEDFIGFFSKADKVQIKRVASILIDFLDMNIKNAPLQEVESFLLIQKNKDVFSNVQRNPKIELVHFEPMFKKLDEIIHKQGTMILPIGNNHGDLTFSNILFARNKLFLIDFLDTFIETPLNDIVKMRQDTAHYWSFFMHTKAFDKIKLKIILRYLDQIIDAHYQDYAFYRNYYTIFQVLNFLRILQYAQDENVIHYLECEINKLLGTYNV